jgi:DNA-binding MarR family transcriptional regulator
VSRENINIDNALCFAIYSTNHAITRAYKPLLDKHGLTYPQYLVMLVLWERDGQTVGGIGEQLFLESSTLTPLLKRLEAAGLVGRERDTKDERQVVVRLTKDGEALRDKLADVPRHMLKLFGCGSDGAERIRAEVTELRHNIAKATENGA